MVDLFLVRQLKPWHGNLGKRLVKSPKVYLRDSGILHALLAIDSREQLLGHPKLGDSFEGFVIEQILSVTPSDTATSFKLADAAVENGEGTIQISSYSIVGSWHRSWCVLIEWRDFELLWRDYENRAT